MRARWKLLALAAAAAAAAGAVFAVRHNIPARLSILHPDKRVENFRRFDRLFPYRTVRKPETPFRFRGESRDMRVEYTFRGETQSLEELLGRTITTGFLVVKDDAIVHERYMNGGSEFARFTSWSVAKSFVSALIGIAIAEGRIGGVDDPVTKYLPELEGSGYDGVPIKAILQMRSGIRFSEEYENYLSDVHRIFAYGLHMPGGLRAYPRSLTSEQRPGAVFHYASVDTQVLGILLTEVTRRPLSEYLEEKLWGPLGMESDACWAVDGAGPRGMEFAFCCLNAALRDYAKFGRLFLRKGEWEGTQIVPAAWVEESTRPESAYLTRLYPEEPENPLGYQYQWWPLDGADGEFTGIGVWGQFLYVNPAENLIIVKTSVDPDFDRHEIETLAAFRAIARALTARDAPGS